jgi:hypothetical protein
LPGKPRFLGYIPQQYRVYGGNVTQDFSHFIGRIDKQIQEDIVRVLKVIDPSLVASGMRHYELGHVQNLSALVGVGQRDGVPIWKVGVGTAEQKESARVSFSSLARRIVELTGVGGKAHG